MSIDRRLIDGRRFPYFVVEQLYVEHGHAARMGGTGWLIFCALLCYARRDNCSPLSISELMEATRKDKKTVLRAVADIVRQGYVTREIVAGGRGGRTSVYRIVELTSVPVPASTGGKTPPVGGDERGGEKPPVVVEIFHLTGGEIPPVVVEKSPQSGGKTPPQTVVPPTPPSCREEQTKQQQQELTADAAASAAPEAEQADIARQARALLILQGVASDVAAQLVNELGSKAMATVNGMISRANGEKPRNRPAWLVAGIRDGYVVPEPMRPAAPEERRARVMADHADRTGRRAQEREWMETREQDHLDTIRRLDPQERVELEERARRACPMAKGTLETSPVLRGWAISEINRAAMKAAS